MLNLAIELAANLHGESMDRVGNPYILHPIRVMLACATEQERIAAVLHDTIEDTPLSLPELRLKGFSDDVIEAVDALSKREEENYEDYIDRLVECELACTIKLADLCDNIWLVRSLKAGKKNSRREEKYCRAAKQILRHIRLQNDDKIILHYAKGDYGDRVRKFIKELV